MDTNFDEFEKFIPKLCLMANIGEYIKKSVDRLKISNMEEFCKTHLNMGKQSFYKNLKKSSLNSDLILRYCKVFNIDFFAHFYEEEPLKTFKEQREKEIQSKIDSLIQKIKEREDTISDKKNIILLLEKENQRLTNELAILSNSKRKG